MLTGESDTRVLLYFTYIPMTELFPHLIQIYIFYIKYRKHTNYNEQHVAREQSFMLLNSKKKSDLDGDN